MRSAASAVRTCAPPAQSGRAGRFFRCGRPLVLQACSSACETALTGAALWGAMPAAPVAGLQRARPRESAPAYSWQIGRARAPRGASDGGDPQRARPASGAPMCRGTARGSGRAAARGPVFRKSRRPRAPRFQWFNWSGARACQGISWNCVNGFATVRKRLVQANACSGRPRRDPPLGCGADGPAQHGPPRGRSRDRALLNSIDARLPRCSGSLPCQRGAHSVRRRMSLSVLRAARGQRVLCGTEWTLCAPTGGAALPGSAASLVAAARAAALARERARVRPIRYTAHARAAASAVRCEPRVRRCAHSVGRAAARVFRAGPSLGRWRCGSCAFRPRKRGVARGSAGYLVDPASSHMLVSKIKPCMSKYKRLYCETANGSLNQLWFI